MRFRAFVPMLVAVSAACLAAATPAAAQCLLCDAAGESATPTDMSGRPAGQDRPLRVDIIADLDFARLIAGARGGSARINPLQGGTLVSGDVRTAAGMGFSGRLMVVGTPGRTVRIMLPDTAVLTSLSGGRVEITRITTGQAPVQRIGPDGRLEIPFGGDLQVTGAVDGDFRGRIAVTVSYE